MERYNCLSQDRHRRGETKATPQTAKKYTAILRVSFKSWCTCSGLIKIAHPTVPMIPEMSRYYPAAACTVHNSKEACSSWAHPSASPSPFNRCIKISNSLEISPHDLCICALLTIKRCPYSFGTLHYSRIFHLKVSK